MALVPGRRPHDGSVTILLKNGLQQEFRYLALADVVRGAHLSVFVAHPFELAPETSLLWFGRS